MSVIKRFIFLKLKTIKTDLLKCHQQKDLLGKYQETLFFFFLNRRLNLYVQLFLKHQRI